VKKKGLEEFDPDGLVYFHPDLIRLNKNTLQQNHFLRRLESDEEDMSHRLHTKQDSQQRGNCNGNGNGNQPKLQLFDRSIVVSKLLDIFDAFEDHMSPRTLYFAIALMDKYVVSCEQEADPFRIEQPLLLLGATCLHVASKCEDVTYIGIRDLTLQAVEMDGEGFTGKDILNLEEKLLNVLNFDLYLPTIIDFLNIYTDCIKEFIENKQMCFFAKYIAESSLVCEEVLYIIDYLYT